MNPCNICQIDPTSHSFRKIRTCNHAINLFYSCPAKATKYYESAGVIEHFRLYLEENGDNAWAYILDCKGYTLAHTTQINTSVTLVNMVKDKYIGSLKKVWIVNYSWQFGIVMNILLALLPDDVKRMVELSDKTVEQIQNLAFII